MKDTIKDQDIEISGLKARVKSLEDKESRREETFQKDAPITGGIIDIGEEFREDKSTEKGSNDTEEMVNVLSSIEAANIFSSGGAAISTASVSPADVFPTVGKEKVTETEVPKKKKLQEQIDAQVAREMEEEFARENQRIYTEEELKLMIEGLDMSNEVIAKHLSEYEQAEADLSVGEKIELIRAREVLHSVLKSHAGWKTEHFRGMTLEQIKEKFIPVWKHMQDFVPMSSKEESEKGSKGVSEEELKGMMQLVPLEEVYIEALQQFDREDLHQLWILVKETFSIKQCTRDKEKGLWVELKRLFEPDSEDQLWTYHQAFMHDPLYWKLYDTCGVHHVSTKKNQEIFMLVEKDYPLRKELATVMINNKLQVEQYS
nr:hypothetical protein [Tanacetum cinerariifolium]